MRPTTPAGRLAILAALAPLLLTACGSTTTREVTVEKRVVVAPAAHTTPSAPAAPNPRPASPGPTFSSCDANIRAKQPNTTCAFASNVFWSFWHAWQSGDDTFDAYSPATAERYAMSCTRGGTVVCRTQTGAEVRFPMQAVRAYTWKAAHDYAAAHDTGTQAHDTSASSSDCDPDYEGACLDPNASDYDCEGGSGDGPEYTGQVRSVGDDPYDLDRDGDGIGCD